MRATASRPACVLAALLVGVLAFAGFAACVDFVHLDPPNAGGGAGGGTASTCLSSPDCTYPTPVCDTVTQTCVGCLTTSDCSYAPGSVCSGGQCSCPSGVPVPLTYCAAPNPGCFDTQTASEHCGTCGNACDAASCIQGLCGGEGTDAGAEGGIDDGGPDGSAGCVPTCRMAIETGGTVCPTSPGSVYFDQTTACAGCSGAGPCQASCVSFCGGNGVDAVCETCLVNECPASFMNCGNN